MTESSIRRLHSSVVIAHYHRSSTVLLTIVLDRVNIFTNVTYNGDPTIFAWGLINEPRCLSDPSGDKLKVCQSTLWLDEEEKQAFNSCKEMTYLLLAVHQSSFDETAFADSSPHSRIADC